MKHEKQQSVLFTAELQHSEETFYRLARVQAQLYGALGKVFVIFCGFALIAAALFALQESTGRLVLLFFGCWTISCSALPARPEAFEAFLEERTGCTRENVPSFVTLRALRRSAGVLFHKG